MNEYLIEFESASLGYGKVKINGTAGKGIPEGVTVIIGDNGSGKSTLGSVISKGRFAYGNRMKFKRENLSVKMLAFTDIYSLSGMEVQYRAQRFEATANDYVPTVEEILGQKVKAAEWQELSTSLGLLGSEAKKINFLSSGELRKLIVINALIDHPDILVLDNPYIGLDKPSRKELDNLISRLPKKGISVVMLICDIAEIPPYSDNVMLLDECQICSLLPAKEYIPQIRELKTEDNSIPFDLPPRHNFKSKDYEIAFSITDGHIRYGDKEIFSKVNWTVKRGEQWILKGRNGSGKSLLLAMVCADHPQGYANHIILFDRRRGSGESIWEIKDNIGYVSPEMQLFFKASIEAGEIVARGARNSLNALGKLSEEEKNNALVWMKLLGIENLYSRKYNELSTGEQRLVILAAALIRQPELLVLDEPLHGLDHSNKKRVIKLIECLRERNGTSLIFVTHDDTEIPHGPKLFMDISGHRTKD